MGENHNSLRPTRWFGRSVYSRGKVDELIDQMEEQSIRTQRKLDAATEQGTKLGKRLQEAEDWASALETRLAGEQTKNKTLNSKMAEADATIAAQKAETESLLDKMAGYRVAAHEAEALKNAAAQEAEGLKKTAAQAKAELKKIAAQYDALYKEKQQTDAENAQQRDLLAEMSARFQRDNMALHEQIKDVRAEMEETKARSKHLTECLEAERQAVREYQSVASKNAVSDANERARKIVADAVTESERILSDVMDQRARINAASRSMYYNALQFKMSMTKRFSVMEKDMDESIDLLRHLDNATLTEKPEAAKKTESAWNAAQSNAVQAVGKDK